MTDAGSNAAPEAVITQSTIHPSPERKLPQAQETDGRRCTESPTEIICEMRLVRKARCMGGRRKIASGRNLAYGDAYPVPSAVATERHADLPSEQALKLGR